MGCHTWANKKVERTIEEARELYLKNLEVVIESWEEMINNPDDACRVAYEWTQEYMEHCLKVYERQMQMVKKGLCNVAVMNHQPDEGSYIEGKGYYIDCDDFHDMFRVREDAEVRLFSLQETLDYIKQYEEKYKTFVEIYKIEGHEKNTLEEFWYKYPDGMIYFC